MLWLGLTTGAYTVGAGLVIAFLVPLAWMSPTKPVNEAAAYAAFALLGGSTLLLLGGLLLLPLLMEASAASTRERNTAFLTYGRSLRERLGLERVLGTADRPARRLFGTSVISPDNERLSAPADSPQ